MEAGASLRLVADLDGKSQIGYANFLFLQNQFGSHWMIRTCQWMKSRMGGESTSMSTEPQGLLTSKPRQILLEIR